MRSVKIALAVVVSVGVVAIGLVLAERPLAVLHSNSVKVAGKLDRIQTGRARICQTGESLPRGTVAIRPSLEAFTGPSVTATVLSGSRVVASGKRGSGWSGSSVTVHIATVSNTIAPVEVCFASGPIGDRLSVEGAPTGRAKAAYVNSHTPLEGRMRVEYLTRGHASWLSLAGSTAEHMGLGRAWSGTWVAVFVAILMILTATLAMRLAVREFRE